MPPPNLTAATALPITFPYDVTTDPESNSDELWYTFTATSAMEPAVGFHSYGASTYLPQINVKSGPLPTPTDYLGGYYATRKSILVPVTAGVEYWIVVSGGSGSSYTTGDTFRLTGALGPNQPVPRGAIIVPDDTPGFPALILDADSGAPLRYVDLPAGEIADTLPSGHILTEDVDNPNDLQLFDGSFNLVATLTGRATGTMRIRTNGVDKFYTSNGTNLISVDADGNMSASQTLAATPLFLAPNLTDTILYYASSGTGAAVRRWDLVGQTALSDLAAGVTNYFVGRDGYVLADGSILVHYFKTSGGVDHFVRRYDPSGSIIQTYAFGTTAINQLSRSDDDSEVRVWTQSSGQGTFRTMALSDGSLSTGFTQYDMVGGVSEEPATATPTAPFGHSFSCPFFPFFGPSSTRNPVLDPSDPCCVDFSTLLAQALGCDVGPLGGPGSTGPMNGPSQGTWSNSLNATGGTSGGGSGASWSAPDPTINEDWT